MAPHHGVPLLAAALVLFAAPSALAQEPEKKTEDRNKVDLVYDDGLTARVRDKDIELKVLGSAHLDSRFYFGPTTAPDSFDARRARLELNGKYGMLSARLQLAMEDTMHLRNAYVDIGPLEELHLTVGQFKVPFSTQWQSQENHGEFLERAAGEPISPFFDRGAMLWGRVLEKTLTYQAGVFDGNGMDIDAPRSDVDGSKLFAARLFAQPFRNTRSRALENVYLTVQGTYEPDSAPTRRFERALNAPTQETQYWRFRLEQQLGTNGRNVDQTTAEIGKKYRAGAELHYMLDSFTFGTEWALLRYQDIRLFHDLSQGATRLRHDHFRTASGTINSISAWVSLFVTGEKKTFDAYGFRQPNPKRPVRLRDSGAGAWELVLRGTFTTTTQSLLNGQRVDGFAQAGVPDLKGAAPGQGASVNVAPLEGARQVGEVTAGVNWTLSYNLRVMVNYTYLWVPDASATNGLVSGGNSELPDFTFSGKNRLVSQEHEIGARLIVRL